MLDAADPFGPMLYATIFRSVPINASGAVTFGA